MSVLLQLNVHLAPGQRTREGHSWAGRNSPYHVELFDRWDCLKAGMDYWQDKGVKCELGKMTARAKQ